VLASAALVAIAGSAVLCGLVYVIVARWRWHQPAARLTTGVFASAYVNAGNLGIPISAYVLGDASYVAPVLLFQVLVISPVGLSILTGARPGQSGRRQLTQPLRTPLVLGCAAGLVLGAADGKPPTLVWEPVELVATLAVPAALLAYGLSLCGAPAPATGERRGPVWLAVGLKTLAQPAFAYLLGRWVAGLHDTALLAVTLTAALPTAQNVFVYARPTGRAPTTFATSSC
jgi:malonate transporter and related proteins